MYKFNRIAAAGALIVILATACNLPSAASPTPFTFPTPDLTLTAIFSPVAPTATSQVQVSTATSPAGPTATQAAATSAPTATSAPVNTAVPTNTSIPQATATGVPLVRGGDTMRATFLSSAPNIDGNLSEWNLTKYQVKYVVFGREDWENDVDLSGWFQIGWDNNNLYLAGHVFDDNDVQEATGENLFKGDSFEIVFDTNLAGDFYTRELGPDDFQLGFSPGPRTDGEDTEAYRWFPSNIKGSLSNVNLAARPDKDDYEFEVAIPWSVLEMTPVSGQHYGFAFSLSDNDTRGTQQQETMMSTASGRRLGDPTTWNDLVLVK
jgi:hypothetical protein